MSNRLFFFMLFMLILIPLAIAPNPNFNAVLYSERHGLFNHEVILNVTNNGVNDKYQFKMDLDKLNSNITNQEVFYLNYNNISWTQDQYGWNETTNTSYYIDTISYSKIIEEWLPATINEASGNKINATAKKATLNILSGESVLIKINWLQEALKNILNKYESTGNWSINPDGFYNVSYGYRRRINITANTTDILRTNFTVNLTLPREVIGNISPSGNDLIIVWNNSGNQIEIDRINTTQFNNDGGTTDIWFRVQANIEAGKSNDSYFIYYNATGASIPLNNTANIFSRIPEQNESRCAIGMSFREGAGASVDDHCNKATGTITGNVIWNSTFTPPIGNTTMGMQGDYSLEFGAFGTARRLQFADTNILDFNNQITMETWINFNGSYTDGYACILGKWENPYEFALCITGGTRTLAPAFNGVVYTNLNVIIPLNQWLHIISTFDEDTSTAKHYINGTLMNIQTIAQSLINSTSTFNIGAAGSATSNQFGGFIDEVAVYRGNITDQEVFYRYWRRAHHYNGWRMSIEGTALSAPITPSMPNITYPAVNYTRVINGTIEWNASTGGSGITYRVYVNGTLNASGITTTSYNIQGLIAVRDYLIGVEAINDVPLTSTRSERIITFAEKLDYETSIAIIYAVTIATLIYLFANIGSGGRKETDETE